MKKYKIILSPSIIYYYKTKEIQSNRLELAEDKVLDFFQNLRVSKHTINKDEEQRKINKVLNHIKGKTHKVKKLRDGQMRDCLVTSTKKIKDFKFKDVSIKEIK